MLDRRVLHDGQQVNIPALPRFSKKRRRIVPSASYWILVFCLRSDPKTEGKPVSDG